MSTIDSINADLDSARAPAVAAARAAGLPDPPHTGPARGIAVADIADYVATSVVLHCHDGWNLVGRAIDSLITGDPYTAVHLSYYAELRAIMSLMAAEGIGVLDKKQIWFDSAEAAWVENTKGTHAFVKDAFEEWAGTVSKAGRLLDVIRVRSKSLSEWVAAAIPGTSLVTTRLVTKDWLEKWSIDINRLQNDQNIRNISSYRPQNLRRSNPPKLRASLRLVCAFWRACEPDFGSFRGLDRYLLRNLLEKLYEATGVFDNSGRTLKIFLTGTLNSLGLASDSFLRKFLLREANRGEHPLLAYSKKPGILETGKIKPVPVIARAIILSRLATGVASDTLAATNIDMNSLRFWWDSRGSLMGLWPHSGFAGHDMADLWADIAPTLEAVERWIPTARTDDFDLAIRASLPFDLLQLNKIPMAGLWATWR